MNQLALSTDLNVITAEINSFKQVAGQAVFEIGSRLKHVKENDLAHGQWESWCETSLSMSVRQARKYIRVFERFSNRKLTSVSIERLDMLTAFDDEELDTPTELPSGEIKKPFDMSQKEIEQYKRAQAEAEKRAETAEAAKAEAEQRAKQLESETLRAKQELADRPERIVIKEDKHKLEQQRLENERLQKRITQLQNDAELLRKKAQLNDKEAKEYAELKKQIDFLHREKNDLHRQIESATAIAGLSVKIDHFLKTELSPIRYSRVLEQMDSPVAAQNLTEIIESVESWCEDMRKFLPNKKRIEVEVIDG